MENAEYTPEEFREFDRLSRNSSSRDQVIRIEGRLGLRKFVDTHGKAKCDAMWAKIMAEAKATKRKG